MTERQTKIESGDWTAKYKGTRVLLYYYGRCHIDFHEAALSALIKVLRGIQMAVRKKRGR